MSLERATNPFSADRPISSKSEDLLGRSTFSESLAQVVEGWTGNDSLVMALYGPWGIRKSSIKNMVLEHLRRKGPSAPTIVEFVPWQWAAQDKMAEAFFREVALALGKKDDAKEAKKHADQFSAYAAYLKVGSHLATGIRPLVATVLFAAGLLGVGGSLQGALWLKPYLRIGGVAALAFAALIKWWTEFAEKAAAAFSSQQKLQEKNLQETKADVAGMLKRLKTPILVVIDDLDRLTADEVRLVFQLVKANADFPNLVYLTLFQRDIVEKNLEKATSGSGKDFLEKIVQVGFDVPQVEQSKLQRVLFARLDEVLADPKVSKNFKQYRWGNLFPTGLGPYFRTLRDVHRFMGVLDVQISRMAPEGSFEVNPVDLIALEVLRVFEPAVYHLLPSNKKKLTELSGSPFRRSITDAEKDSKHRLDPPVDAAQPGRKAPAREILEDLFPALSDGNEAVFFRELRVCHPDVFDRYFLLSIPEGDISRADIDTLMASTSDRDGLVAKFAELKNRELLEVALGRLEAYKEEISIADTVPFITALFDIGDDLPEGKGETLGAGPWMLGARSIRSLLMKEPEKENRYRYLSEATGISYGLYLPSMVVALESDMHKEGRLSHELLLERDSIEKLKATCVDKIRRTAENRRLSCHPKFGSLLGFWTEWAAQEAKAWVDEFTQSSAGLIAFLEAMTRKSIAYQSGAEPRVSWYIQLTAIARFIDPMELERRVASLKPLATDESQSRALKAFQEALARQRDGKLDGAPWRDWYPEN